MAAASIDTPPIRFSGLASSLPIADRDILIGLSDNDIRTWSAVKAEDYRRFALVLLSIYNSVAPIHRLPVEVLSAIFGMCWKDRKSFRIGHVCHQWRSVLLDTSGFWASAVKREQFREGDCATGYLEAVLKRSMPQVLAPSFQHFSDRMSPFLALHADRITSLTASLSRFTQHADLWRCLNAGMHSLGTLTISGSNDYWSEAQRLTTYRPLRLLPTSLPRLTCVTAPGGFLQYFAVPSLRHITLQNTEDPNSHNRLRSDAHLQNALAVCAQSLETLSLLNVAPVQGFRDVPLSLPALHKLVIEDKARSCALMLSRLVLSDPTARIHVHVTDSASLSDAVPLDASVVQTALSATDCVGIACLSHTIGIHCSSGETETELLSISLRAAETRNGPFTPDDLVRFFRHKPGGPVLIVVLGELDRRDVQAVDLRAFPGIRGLITSGSMAHHVLQELARTDGTDGDGRDDEGIRGARARCPELELLNLEHELKFGVDLERGEDGKDPKPALGLTQMGPRGAVIDADFRSLCAELELVLAQRQTMGIKLSRLTLGCPDMRQPGTQGETGSAVAETHPSELEPWGRIVERLEKLVDNPIMFGST